MKQIKSLEEIKRIEFNLLCSIDNICRANKIRYTLSGGTLLGAVRHKGFIPWDDDIDLAMPRPDYNRFINFCSNNNVPFGIACAENENFADLYMKVYDNKTILIDKNVSRWNKRYGVFVDIFPIDGLGNEVDKATKKLNKSRFKRELLNSSNWNRFFKSKTKSILYEPIRLIFFILSRFVEPYKLIASISSEYEKKSFEDSAYVGVVCGVYRNREIFLKYIYTDIEDIEFEGRLFRAIKNSDLYLKQFYGDYMTLPPVEKRVSHHTFEAYYI